MEYKPISFDELGLLLQYSCGETHGSKGENDRCYRAQPSGGARFPIEMYIIVLRGEGLEQGVYHYNVQEHGLDVLWKKSFSKEEIKELFSDEWVGSSSAVLCMTSVFERNYMKYGERGYRHILLEAGHIGQNIYLASGALSLSCSATTGTDDEGIETLLDIDGVTESLVYTIVVGKMK
jgi:SagB-type dehydrogenase family enzyme